MPQELDLDVALQRIAGELSTLAGRIKHESEVIEGAGEDAERAGMDDTADAAKDASKAEAKAAESIEKAAEDLRDASDEQREAADEAKGEASETVTTEDVADDISEGNPLTFDDIEIEERQNKLVPQYKYLVKVKGEPWSWATTREQAEQIERDVYLEANEVHKRVAEGNPFPENPNTSKTKPMRRAVWHVGNETFEQPISAAVDVKEHEQWVRQNWPDAEGYTVDDWPEGKTPWPPEAQRVSKGNPIDDEPAAAGDVGSAVAEGIEKGNPIDSGDLEDLGNDILDVIEFVEDLIEDAESEHDKTELRKIKSKLKNAEDVIGDPAQWPITKNVSKGNPFWVRHGDGHWAGPYDDRETAQGVADAFQRNDLGEASVHEGDLDSVQRRVREGNPIDPSDVAATEAGLDVDTQDAVAASAAADTKPKASHPYYRPLFKIGG